MHHPMLGMLMVDVAQVGLKPEQQAVVDSIHEDLEKQAAALKEPHAQLSNDLAEGAAAGKLDKAKIDADTKKLVQAGDASAKSVQDAANKLHQTLDANQRKKLVELVRARGEEMLAHGMGPMHGHGPGEPALGAKGAPPGPKNEPAAPVATPHSPATSSAQKPDSAPAQKGPGGPGGPHHGPGGPGMSHPGMHPEWAIDKLGESLGLTQEQRDKLKAKMDVQMKSHMGAMKAEHAAMQKRMKAIADAFESEKFDAKKAGLGEKHGDMMKNMLKARVEFVEMVLSVLTPEQRAKFAEHIKQHAEMGKEPQ
jgi:Spy/CpxP family protein refolding chaperone